MPLLLRNLRVPTGTGDRELKEQAARRLGLEPGQLLEFTLVRQGLDARQKGRIQSVCTVRFRVTDEAALLAAQAGNADLLAVAEETPPVFPRLRAPGQVMVVGMGPAGLFAALRLAEYGIAATLLERGRPVAERVRDVQGFWASGRLDPESNVQFGEGGAGTFSDGKLTTRVNDPASGYVLRQLVDCGAPAEILVQAKPHVGTDRLRGVVVALRQRLLAAGCEIRFGCRLEDLVVPDGRLAGIVSSQYGEEPCHALVLAPGNSARDTYRLLAARGVALRPKPFAVGFRVEHPQELVNRIQYGVARHPRLPPADYALAWNDPASGRGVYSFCMCPGGVVVAGSTASDGVVTNGMSDYRRDAVGANSALVVSVTPDDFPQPGPLGGIALQEQLERAAFQAGGGGFVAPAQNLLAFLGKGSGPVRSSYRPGVREAELAGLLPGELAQVLRRGIEQFGRKMRGFVTAEATLTGVESRTSAPLWIERGADYQSCSLPGLYPAGEGAGYAGGIMSAALDGIRVADAIAARLQRPVGAA